MQDLVLLKCQTLPECLAKLVDEMVLAAEQLVLLEIEKELELWHHSFLPQYSVELVAVAVAVDPAPSDFAAGLFESLPH